MRAKREKLDIEIARLPSDQAGSYLEYLNKCFPGWGGEQRYNDVFFRDWGAGCADRLLAYHEGKVVGGTSVTYRLMSNRYGNVSKMAVMTGTWTFRAARGRGCYEALIAAMHQTAVERDCALLCGYTTKKNATYKSLLKQGLEVVNSNYLTSSENSWTDNEVYSSDSDISPVTDQMARQHYAQIQRSVASTNRFVYDYDVWKIQFLDSDTPKIILVFDDESSAIAEVESGQFKVLSFAYSSRTNMQHAMATIVSASRASGVQLFMYTLDNRVVDVATSVGLVNNEGGFFLKHASQLAFRKWFDLDSHLELRDEDLVNVKHPSWVGDWVIQNGDRA